MMTLLVSGMVFYNFYIVGHILLPVRFQGCGLSVGLKMGHRERRHKGPLHNPELCGNLFGPVNTPCHLQYKQSSYQLIFYLVISSDKVETLLPWDKAIFGSTNMGNMCCGALDEKTHGLVLFLMRMLSVFLT